MANAVPNVSRPILSLEMLLCFLPVTWLWLAVLASTATGHMSIPNGLAFLSASAIGPIGFFFAFRAVVLRRTALSRAAFWLMAAFGGWTLLSYLGAMLVGGAPASEWWRAAVLIALLPAVGVAHLALLSRRPEYGLVRAQ